MSNPYQTSKFVPQKIRTNVWADVPDETGKKTTLCHGYDFYNDILGRYSFSEILFLLIKGELPSKKESIIINILMTSIINPGPKDWATLAAMTASVSNTTVGNSLIAGVSALQSRYNGGLCVEKSMEMFKDANACYSENNDINQTVDQIESKYPDMPGYGLDRSDVDKKAKRFIHLLKEEKAVGSTLDLAIQIEKIISNKNIWLTMPGVISATLLDLKFEPLDGHGLFIISSLPGILSHILGQMKKGKWNDFPFYDSPEYNPLKIHELSEAHKVYGGEDV